MQSGNAQAVAELLKAGADLNAKDARGDTPIFFGITEETETIPAICELLAWKPDLAVTESVMGMTPLELAIERDLQEIAALLRKFGAPEPRIDIDQESETIEVDSEKIAAIEESPKPRVQVVSGLRNFVNPETITPEDLAMARQVDEESQSLFHVFGYQASAPHMSFLRKSREPNALVELAYFARGFRNAPAGRELQDGPRVLGETYQSAVQRFVDLGFLSQVDEPRAIALAHTSAELSVIAKKNAIKVTRTATKQEISERLFGMLGIAPFAARLESKGGYFEVTPDGAKETDKFDENRSQFVAQKIVELLDALTHSNFLEAAKIAWILASLKKYVESPMEETDPRNIAGARCIRARKMPSSLVFEPDSEKRYLVIASAFVLCRSRWPDWDFWDKAIKPLKSTDGEVVNVAHLADALLVCE